MNEKIKFVYAMIFFISLFFVLKDVNAGKSFLLTYFLKKIIIIIYVIHIFSSLSLTLISFFFCITGESFVCNSDYNCHANLCMSPFIPICSDNQCRCWKRILWNEKSIIYYFKFAMIYLHMMIILSLLWLISHIFPSFNFLYMN
jgi:hypothetical protein